MKHFTIIDVPQRSPEWFAARCGRLTGSVAADILKSGRKKGEESVARRDLRLVLATEQITGEPEDGDGFVSKEMQRGIDKERDALALYEARTGLLVSKSGFISHRSLLAGCSLDGHVGDFEGIVEVKCPKRSTHVRYWKAGELPDEYRPQVLHNLWVTGASWADFVSFDDRFHGALQLFRVRVTRDALQAELEAYDQTARLFLAEVEQLRQELEELERRAA